MWVYWLVTRWDLSVKTCSKLFAGRGSGRAEAATTPPTAQDNGVGSVGSRELRSSTFVDIDLHRLPCWKMLKASFVQAGDPSWGSVKMAWRDVSPWTSVPSTCKGHQTSVFRIRCQSLAGSLYRDIVTNDPPLGLGWEWDQSQPWQPWAFSVFHLRIASWLWRSDR